MKHFDDSEERFESFTDSSDKEGCWPWLGALNGSGYGVFWMNRKQHQAHRISYTWHIGPIPHGTVVMHKCDNPKCVNPKHLDTGFPWENTRDAIQKGRQNPVGENHNMAILAEEQVLAIRADPRMQKEIAVDYNVARVTISAIKTRRNWRHI